MIYPPAFYGLWAILSLPTMINRSPETPGAARLNGVFIHANVYPDTSSCSLPSPLFVDIFPCCGTIDLRFYLPYQSPKLLHPPPPPDQFSSLPILENFVFFSHLIQLGMHCFTATCNYVHIISIFAAIDGDPIAENPHTTILTPPVIPIST